MTIKINGIAIKISIIRFAINGDYRNSRRVQIIINHPYAYRLQHLRK